MDRRYGLVAVSRFQLLRNMFSMKHRLKRDLHAMLHTCRPDNLRYFPGGSYPYVAEAYLVSFIFGL